MGAPRARFTHPAGRTLVVVGDTVHLVGEVHGKGNAVQAFVASDASGSSRVVGLSHCLEDLVHGVGGESVSALQLLMRLPAAPPNLIQALLSSLHCGTQEDQAVLKIDAETLKKRLREHPGQCFSALAAYQDQAGRFKPISAWVPPRSIHHSLEVTQPWYFFSSPVIY